MAVVRHIWNELLLVEGAENMGIGSDKDPSHVPIFTNWQPSETGLIAIYVLLIKDPLFITSLHLYSRQVADAV